MGESPYRIFFVVCGVTHRRPARFFSPLETSLGRSPMINPGFGSSGDGPQERALIGSLTSSFLPSRTRDCRLSDFPIAQGRSRICSGPGVPCPSCRWTSENATIRMLPSRREPIEVIASFPFLFGRGHLRPLFFAGAAAPELLRIAPLFFPSALQPARLFVSLYTRDARGQCPWYRFEPKVWRKS